MKIEHLVEFICAAHVAQQVEGPFDGRGGIALVAEPGQLKTTIAGAALRNYPNAHVLSDVNVTELANLRTEMVSNRYRTIVFLDFLKVYERNADTASNVEGCLRALVDEGWQGLAHEAQMVTMPARVFLVLCLTPAMLRRKGQAWKDSGFARRFLWLQYAIANPEVRIQAANRWQKVPIGDLRIPWPIEKIPMRNTVEENDSIQDLVSEQPGGDTSIQFQVLAKTYQVLKWHYRQRRGNDRNTPKQIMAGMAELLKRQGGQLVLTPTELHTVRPRKLA